MNIKQKEKIFEAEALSNSAVVYRVALRMARNTEDAKELVQETFLQAWKSFEKYEQGTNCRAWLCKILFHKHSGLRRKRYAQSKYVQDVDDFVFLNATAPVSISEHLTDETVIGALDQLPEYYRSVVLLADVYDYKYREVSDILQIPLGTVMSRLNRARTVLRKSLEPSPHFSRGLNRRMQHD